MKLNQFLVSILIALSLIALPVSANSADDYLLRFTDVKLDNANVVMKLEDKRDLESVTYRVSAKSVLDEFDAFGDATRGSYNNEYSFNSLDIKPGHTYRISLGYSSLTGNNDFEDFEIVTYKAFPSSEHNPQIISKPLKYAYTNDVYSYRPEYRDIDGDSVVFYLIEGPEGAKMINGEFSWFPKKEDAGFQGNIKIGVKDMMGGSDEQDFGILVYDSDIQPNIPPEITSTAPIIALVGEEYTYKVNATDLDGDDLKYTLFVGNPDGMTLGEETGILSWTPSTADIGVHKITLQVKDDFKVTTKSFYLKVTDEINLAKGYPSQMETVVPLIAKFKDIGEDYLTVQWQNTDKYQDKYLLILSENYTFNPDDANVKKVYLGNIENEYTFDKLENRKAYSVQILKVKYLDDSQVKYLDASNIIRTKTRNKKQLYTDYYSNDAYGLEMAYLKYNKIFKGYYDGTFRPYNHINRAELITTLVRAFHNEPSVETYNNCFNDVKEEWFAPYVCFAKEKQWISGVTNPDGSLTNMFHPNDIITKVAALKILVNAFNFENSHIRQSYRYVDFDKNLWYSEYVKIAYSHGILPPKEHYLRPGLLLTREDFAVFLYKTLIGKELNTSYSDISENIYDRVFEVLDLI